MALFDGIGIISFFMIFAFTLFLSKRSKQTASSKYLPSIFLFIVSFFGIVAGIFWINETGWLDISLLSTGINVLSLLNIVISVLLDLLKEANGVK